MRRKGKEGGGERQLLRVNKNNQELNSVQFDFS